jgi:hypothetical protein
MPTSLDSIVVGDDETRWRNACQILLLRQAARFKEDSSLMCQLQFLQISAVRIMLLGRRLNKTFHPLRDLVEMVDDLRIASSTSASDFTNAWRSILSAFSAVVHDGT